MNEKVNNQSKNICSTCNFPGSFCVMDNDQPKCICDFINCESDNIKVCGDDGQTYASICDLMKFSCSEKINTRIAHIGQCSMGMLF